MKRLIEGFKKFQRDVFKTKRELFTGLARGQQPRTLFITCSDSRIDPCLVTQTEPGELFILRNAGNLVPLYGTTIGSTIATIEYAVGVLDVKISSSAAIPTAVWSKRFSNQSRSAICPL